MIRHFVCLTALSLMAACAEYQEPKANCFNLLANTEAGEPNCAFLALDGVEIDSDL